MMRPVVLADIILQYLVRFVVITRNPGYLLDLGGQVLDIGMRHAIVPAPRIRTGASCRQSPPHLTELILLPCISRPLPITLDGGYHGINLLLRHEVVEHHHPRIRRHHSDVVSVAEVSFDAQEHAVHVSRCIYWHCRNVQGLSGAANLSISQVASIAAEWAVHNHPSRTPITIPSLGHLDASITPIIALVGRYFGWLAEFISSLWFLYVVQLTLLI